MSSRGVFQFTTWLVWSKHVTPKAAKKDRFDLFGSLLQILCRQGSIFVCGPLHHYVQLFIIFWPVYPIHTNSLFWVKTAQTIPNNVYWVYWVIGSVSFSFRSFQSVVFETFNSMEATVNFSLLSVFFFIFWSTKKQSLDPRSLKVFIYQQFWLAIAIKQKKIEILFYVLQN